MIAQRIQDHLVPIVTGVVGAVLLIAIAPVVERFFFWQAMAATDWNAAGIAASLERSKPLRKQAVDPPAIEARAAKLVYYNEEAGKERVLLAHNATQTVPIASISKLMTATVARETFDLSEYVSIEKTLKEDNGEISKGAVFTVEDLLYLMLVDSNNTAAHALAQKYGFDSFVSRMNRKATELGMTDTTFVDTTGLDPDAEDGEYNTASASDVVQLFRKAYDDRIISNILHTQAATIYSRQSLSEYELNNTNSLLSSQRILAGKTGNTPIAKECLVVLARAPDGGHIVSVVLGSEERFAETQQLLDWAENAHIY